MENETEPKVTDEATKPTEEIPPEVEINLVEQMQADLDESRDRTLRLAAELENLRKRSERDIADARRYGVSRFAEDMLGVADNLSRALDHVTDDVRQQASKRMLQLIEGVDMTQKSLASALERHGIKQIAAKGEKFDHNLHQAVAQIPSTEFASGVVCQVIQHGYVIGNRTLRAAMVAVSTGASTSGASDMPAPKPDATPGSTIDTKA